MPLTQEQIDQLNGMEQADLDALINPPEPDPMSMDDKVSGLIDAFGGMPQHGEEATPEQIEILENQFRQQFENNIYKMEKQIRAKYPDSTDAQQYELAQAIGIASQSFDVSAVLDVTDKIHKTIREKAERATKEEENLRVEGEPTGGEGAGKGIPSLLNVFRNAAKA